MESTILSLSSAQFSLNKNTSPLSTTLLLTRPFTPSFAAFPPLVFNSFSSSSLRSSPLSSATALPTASGAGDGSDNGDLITLHVTGMMCGGCAASVKRILESQPQVSSATVDLTTETAFVLPVTEAKSSPDWSAQLGESLAKHLSSCGFPSNLGGDGL